MSDDAGDAAASPRERKRRELRSYAIGGGLSLLLTLLPFGLVRWLALSRAPLLLTIGGCAIAQILVQFRFFLHIGWKHKREDLHLILFSMLLMAIMVAGTLWIAGNLATRMAMPGAS